MSDLPQGTSLDSRLHKSVSFLFLSLDSNTLGGLLNSKPSCAVIGSVRGHLVIGLL